MIRCPAAVGRAALLLLWVQAGCARVGDPVEEQCRRQAYDDPAVKDALMRSNSQNQQVRAPALMEMNALVRAQTRNCLALKGLAPPGGVETVKPY